MNLEVEFEPEETDGAPNPIRQYALQRMDAFWIRGLALLARHPSKQKAMAVDCFLLAVGQGKEIGCESAVDISIRNFKTPAKKAAVTKCIKLFQDCLGIEPMPGQRGDKGRAKMAAARKKQLK